MNDETNDRVVDPGRRLLSYLTGAGMVLGPAAAQAAIYYYNPEPDLIAIDTDKFSVDGLQQITVDYSYTVDDFDLGGKVGQATELTDVSILGSVGDVAPPGTQQLVLRPDNFAGTRVSNSIITGGPSLIAAGEITGKGGEITPAVFNPGDTIDRTTASWATPQSGIEVALQDGFELISGVGIYIDGDLSDKGAARVNYGWLRYTSVDTAFILHDLALETEINTPIEAGAIPVPPALPLLASGAAGLALFRRQRAPHRKEQRTTDL